MRRKTVWEGITLQGDRVVGDYEVTTEKGRLVARINGRECDVKTIKIIS